MKHILFCQFLLVLLLLSLLSLSLCLSSTWHDFSRNKSRPRSVRYIKKFIVCPASGALIVKICLLLFSLHVLLLLLVCVKYFWFSFYLEWMHMWVLCVCVRAHVCVCVLVNLTGLTCPHAPCPAIVLTLVWTCVVGSVYFFPLSSWAPLMCRCHCLLGKYLAVHLRILAFPFFFFSLTWLGCSSVLCCSEKVLHCCVIMVAHPYFYVPRLFLKGK